MKISELPLAQSVSTTDDVPIDRSGVTYRVHYEELRGNGIASIAKTGTSGLVDTYTITFTDGSTFSYTVTNGATGSGAWGTITGTLSDQTDLQNALNAKANASETAEALNTKLGKDFSALTALPQAPATTDLLAVRSGSETYKATVGDVLPAVESLSFSDITANWTTGSSYSYIMRCGHIVIASIVIATADATLTHGAWTTLGKVSVKPIADTGFIGMSTHGKKYNITIDTTGTVKVYNYESSNVNTDARCLLVYFTND